MRQHHLAVVRTARYATLGPDAGGARELWVVLHGQGQLAARFLRHFAALDDGTRLVVAPEALSRHYLDWARDASGGPPRVGATWMTRDDREHDIRDYVAYLDAVHAAVTAPLAGRVPLTVLGFSQGAATASRWAALGAVRADRLICWGGAPAPDVPADATGVRGARLTIVAGRDDEYATPAAVAQEEARLRASGAVYERLEYEGGHHLDAATLARLAAAGAP